MLVLALVAMASATTPLGGNASDVYRQTCVGNGGAEGQILWNCRSINVREYPWYGSWNTEVTDPRQGRNVVINITGRHMNAILRTARAYQNTFGSFNFRGSEGGWCIWVNWEK